MTDTPLNPDARRAAFEAVHAIDGPGSIGSMEVVDVAVSAYLAVAQPVVSTVEVTTVEELDALPVGSVVLSESYQYSLATTNYPVAFQKLYTKDWHRGGRASSTIEDAIIPARVLWNPAVNDV